MKQKLLIVILNILLLAIPGISEAQNYVYSVTSGTSWAREQFPKAWKSQAKKNEGNKPEEGVPNFTRIFWDIDWSYRHYHRYNDSIFIEQTQQDWIDMFKRRAMKYSQIYSQNNDRITQIRDYFEGEDVPDRHYDSLYFWTRHLYFRNINDPFLYETLLDILMPHYQERQDVEHLVLCYLIASAYKFQCSRMGQKSDELQSEYYCHKVMDSSSRFAKFQDPLNRYYYISAFVNLAILHSQAGNISLRESLDMMENIEKMYMTPEVQNILAQDSLLNEYAEWSIDLFHFRGIMTYISLNQNLPELRDQLYKEYVERRTKYNNNFDLPNRYYAKLEYDDCMVEAYMGHTTWDEAFKHVNELLKKDKDWNSTTGAPRLKINYLNNMFETLLYIVEHTSMSEDEKGKYVKNTLNHVLNVISRYPHNQYPAEKGMILAEMATNQMILQYLDEKERKELLFRLIVVEQPTTYVHVNMVANLTKVLTRAIAQESPWYLVGTPGYTDADMVQRNIDSIADFAYQAAIMHDLGKISMPSIVNNCFRSLTDHEFQILQLHPEKSRQFFAISQDLSKYKDIALGHHKWYDGEGYPASFKNRRSKYFHLISIVTLCDCMDAATENIGRNYHTPKSFETVMNEFRSGAGSHYDPVLVDFIYDHPAVFEQLKQIVNSGRYEEFFNLYHNYMTKPKPSRKR